MSYRIEAHISPSFPLRNCRNRAGCARVNTCCYLGCTVPTAAMYDRAHLLNVLLVLEKYLDAITTEAQHEQ